MDRGSHIVYKTNSVKFLRTPLQALRQIHHASPLHFCCGEVLLPGQEDTEGEEGLSGRKTFEMPMFMRGNKYHFLVLTVVINERIL